MQRECFHVCDVCFQWREACNVCCRLCSASHDGDVGSDSLLVT